LLRNEYDKFVRSWSSDGRNLAYDVRGVAKTHIDIWVLPLTGDKKPFPFLQTEFRESFPAFSPDSKWMAYVSDESGREEVYVAPFPAAGRKLQVSTGGGTLPLWRGDGKEIFYVTLDNKLMAAEVTVRGDTFQVGAVKMLFEARMRRPGTIYDVTRDGRRFLVNTLPAQQSTPPFVLVVNWPADLKK
jgi:Tol biopolymer transport system component